MKAYKLLNILEEIAPVDSQENWDNSGVQILIKDDINVVLTALEITDSVIKEAENINADMIITHHPLIMSEFDPLKNIDINTPRGRYITALINAGISVYSSHTPFDKAENGNNDRLAGKLGLTEIKGFEHSENPVMIGRTGFFPEEITPEELVNLITDTLNIKRENVRTAYAGNGKIKKAALCTGAGADLMYDAYKCGCDVLITGDVKYHDAQNASALGLCLIDAGHYETEKDFSVYFAEELMKKTGDELKIIVSETDINPFK